MNNRYILSFLTLVLLVSCTTEPKSKYEKLIADEMSKDIRHDSIFLGFDYGIKKADFFVVCKELNEKKLVVQANKSGFVQYIFPPTAEKDKDLIVLFWGVFTKNLTMTGLTFEITHVAWSPWNEESKPENLIPVVQSKFMEWFPGNDFVNIITVEDQKNIWVKIDGNRRITIEEPDNVTSVKVNIDDLRRLKK